MKFIAVQKNTRQTPRKVRLVANQIKDLPLEQALGQLSVIRRKSTLVLLKTFKQAIANAKNNHGVSASDLEIDSVTVTDGTRLRRFRAVSRGRAHGVIKRNCTVSVVLKQKEAPVAEKKASVAKVAKAKPNKAVKPAAKKVAVSKKSTSSKKSK
jgi:large subunit ribosomal protein L22